MKRYITHAAIRYWIALKWEGSELFHHTHQLLKRFWNSDAACCIAPARSFFYASVSGYLHSFSALLTPLVFPSFSLPLTSLFSTPWVSLTPVLSPCVSAFSSVMLPCVLSFSSISLLNLSRLSTFLLHPPATTSSLCPHCCCCRRLLFFLVVILLNSAP